MAANDPMVVGIGRSPYSRNSGRTTGESTVRCRSTCVIATQRTSEPFIVASVFGSTLP